MDINIDAKELRWVALHEASHAVMAVLKDLACWGIFVQGSGFDCMFCTMVTSGQPLGKGDFLHAAASSGFGAQARHADGPRTSQPGRSPRARAVTGHEPW